MINKETQQKLSTLGIDIEALVKAHTAPEEVPFDLPNGTFLTDEQLKLRDENIAAQAEKTGEGKAVEIAKAEMKKRGLEVKGNRWGDIVNEMNELVNKDKDSKLTQLQEQNSLLLKDVETLRGEVESERGRAKKVMFDHTVMNTLPDNPMGLTKQETLEILKIRGYVPEESTSGVVWKKNGEILKDGATHAPMAADKAVQSIFGELNWNQPPAQGRNIRDTGSGASGGLSTFSEAKKQWTEANPNKSVLSPEFTTFVEAAAKSNPAFAYDK